MGYFIFHFTMETTQGTKLRRLETRNKIVLMIETEFSSVFRKVGQQTNRRTVHKPNFDRYW